MKIDVLTLFPEICRAPLSESIMKRAQENGIIDLRIHNLRGWTKDNHHIVDDAPFGGGQGMVMKAEPIFAAVEELQGQIGEKSKIENRKSKIILMSPAGHRLDQQMATQLSQESHLIIVCGHYEGVDHRLIEHLVDLEISIGDYVLTKYTRPAEYRGWKVPDVLLSGNHAAIAAWRKEQALERTKENRPDLLG